MTGNLIRKGGDLIRKGGETQGGGQLCADGGRDRKSDTRRVASCHLMLEERPGSRSAAASPEGTNPADTMTLDFQPPEEKE